MIKSFMIFYFLCFSHLLVSTDGICPASPEIPNTHLSEYKSVKYSSSYAHKMNKQLQKAEKRARENPTAKNLKKLKIEQKQYPLKKPKAMNKKYSKKKSSTKYQNSNNKVFNMHSIDEINRKESTILKSCEIIDQKSITCDDIDNMHLSCIDVVGSLGDSNTAGMAAEGKKNNVFTLYEARGLSFFTGGDSNVQSVSNFIKYYNNDILGQSYYMRSPSFVFESQVMPFSNYHITKIDGLNAAVSGANSINLKEQVNYILDTMNNGKYHFDKNENTVYAFSLMVGINDACTNCIIGKTPRGATEYRENIEEALDMLINGLNSKYVYIELIGYFKPSIVYSYMDLHPHCKKAFKMLPYYCHCATGDDEVAKEQREFMDCQIDQYNNALKDIAYDNTYQNARIMYNNIYEELEMNNMYNFLSETECFHMNDLSHSMTAVGLWNYMVSTSVDPCTTPINPDNEPACLTEASTISTMAERCPMDD